MFLNGTLIGQIPTNNSTNAFQEILLRTFTVPVGILTQSDTALLDINVPSVTDGYSINFSELTITTMGPVAVEEWTWGKIKSLYN